MCFFGRSQSYPAYREPPNPNGPGTAVAQRPQQPVPEAPRPIITDPSKLPQPFGVVGNLPGPDEPGYSTQSALTRRSRTTPTTVMG